MGVFRVSATTFLLSVLVSCGGGDGGIAVNAGGGTSASLEPLPSYPVGSVSSARTLVVGQKATSTTSMQILQNIRPMASSAGILQMSLNQVTALGRVIPCRQLARESATCSSGHLNKIF